MSASGANCDAYIGNAMVCTRKVMDLVAQVVGFDIIELWTEDTAREIRCTYVYATDGMKRTYPNIITGHYPAHKREHVVSPRLCSFARLSTTRHYWKVKKTPESCLESDSLGIGINTEVSYYFEADGTKVYIVGLMTDKVPFRKKLVKFMAGISYSIYVAAFDLDDDGDDNKDDNMANANNNELSGKQPYLPRNNSKNDISSSQMESVSEGLKIAKSRPNGGSGSDMAMLGSSPNPAASFMPPLVPNVDLIEAGIITQDSVQLVGGTHGQGQGTHSNFSSHHGVTGVGLDLYADDEDEYVLPLPPGRGRVGSATVLQATLTNSEAGEDGLVLEGPEELYEAMPSVIRRLSTEELTGEQAAFLAHGSSDSAGVTSPGSVRTDDNTVDLGTLGVSVGSTDTYGEPTDYPGLPHIYVNAAPGASSSSVVSAYISIMTPTWDPIDVFSYPVAKIKVSCPVPSNLVMEHFTDIQYIADGSNANIFLARLNDEKVVIKMIKEEIQADPVAVHEFNVEQGMLSRVNHPNIIKLIGAGRTPRCFIVLEWLGGGTLNSILQQNQIKPGLAQRLFRKPSFTYTNLLSRAKDITDALHYLNFECHPGATIIHRDLKPDNVGFTADGQLRLFDFGLCICVKARESAEEAYEMTGNTGSLRYMAPEVARKQAYTEKVDVHSFGIMLWQMARDRVPFKGMSREEFMDTVVVRNERPKLDKSWPKPFSDLLLSCWNPKQKARPSFKELSTRLDGMLTAARGVSSTDSSSGVRADAASSTTAASTTTSTGSSAAETLHASHAGNRAYGNWF